MAPTAASVSQGTTGKSEAARSPEANRYCEPGNGRPGAPNAHHDAPAPPAPRTPRSPPPSPAARGHHQAREGHPLEDVRRPDRAGGGVEGQVERDPQGRERQAERRRPRRRRRPSRHRRAGRGEEEGRAEPADELRALLARRPGHARRRRAGRRPPGPKRPARASPGRADGALADVPDPIGRVVRRRSPPVAADGPRPIRPPRSAEERPGERPAEIRVVRAISERVVQAVDHVEDDEERQAHLGGGRAGASGAGR